MCVETRVAESEDGVRSQRVRADRRAWVSELADAFALPASPRHDGEFGLLSPKSS